MGASTAPDPATLMQLTDIVFIMVSDDEAIRQICMGEKGLMRSEEKGKYIINMSTVSPGISKEMSAQFQLQGNKSLMLLYQEV